MKKLKMDVTPLDDAIADVEDTLQAIDGYDFFADEEALLQKLEFPILDSNEDIQKELAGLSVLMNDLELLLKKELRKVEAAQRNIVREEVITLNQIHTQQNEETTECATRRDRLHNDETNLSRKNYHKREMKIGTKSRRRTG